jgi:DNA repair photolyase
MVIGKSMTALSSCRRCGIEDVDSRRIKVAQVECKSALVKSRIQGMAYALNPYRGCEHGCLYCYAEFMRKYTNHQEPWGEFVDIKANVVDRLKVQTRKAKPGTVMLGTVTDAYQPIEEKLGLTRRCLEVLAASDFPVSIQTKSDLAQRDVDVLRRMKDAEVGLTITCPDAEVLRSFEPGAPTLQKRLDALDQLGRKGISTFAFVGPILPFFSDNPAALKSLFRELEKRKISWVYLDRMNYLKSKWRRIKSVIGRRYPKAVPFYERVMASEESYTDWLKGNVKSALRDFGFESQILF